MGGSRLGNSNRGESRAVMAGTRQYRDGKRLGKEVDSTGFVE